jgi:AAA ATPase domain
MAKYLSIAQIREAVSELSRHHVFFGTTFLVLKQAEAPVGKTMRISLDEANRLFLQSHYRVHPKSAHFFMPFKKMRGQTNWVKPKYASTTLQAINTQTFRDALLHRPNENLWGWSTGYLNHLSKHLIGRRKLPLYHLAVWIYREFAWSDEVTREIACQRFVQEFHLTSEEVATLLDTRIASSLTEEASFEPMPAKWQQILEGFAPPEDVPPEQSGTLQLLELSGLGPVRTLRLVPGQRLNLVTGDNGLGKTFLLDLAWWALTQEWAEKPIIPLGRTVSDVWVKFLVATSLEARPVTARFDRGSFEWQMPKQLPAMSSLVVYGRVDGSFAVWDPANAILSGSVRPKQQRSVNFTRENVWNGKTPQIEGLIRDLVKWQSRPDKYPAFHTFEKVLRRIGPPDMGDLSIDEPQRIPGQSTVEIPTLKHPYGTVPVTYESAGIRRVMALSYLIVWAWEEHKIQARQAAKKEERQMVIILDEAEAHLHPKWQRVLLPALVGIGADLHEELAVQFLVATHSPLVMASAEPVFDPDRDKLFHLDMGENGRVTFKELRFALQGSSDSWLQSDVFGLRFAGSAEAERALRRATEMLERGSATKQEIEAVSKELTEHVASEDPFWMRWVLFAAKHGVEL